MFLMLPAITQTGSNLNVPHRVNGPALCIHTIEFCSAIESNKVLKHATLWMYLKDMQIQISRCKGQWESIYMKCLENVKL